MNPGDPAESATAIRGVLYDEALARRLGEQGRRQVVDRNDWKRVAERVEGVYETVAGETFSRGSCRLRRSFRALARYATALAA